MTENNNSQLNDNKAELNKASSNAIEKNPLTTLSVTIKDQNVLYATYMSFVKPYGGLFIPTKRVFAPGDKLSLLLTIIDEQYAIIGKVNWITPQGSHGTRAPGVGIQFDGSKANELNHRIKQLLVLELASKRPTYTM